jgi:hypothetical protein
VFYYLVQDLKALVFSLISLHFKVWLLAVTMVLSSLTLRRSSPSKYVSVAGGAGVYLWNDDYEKKSSSNAVRPTVKCTVRSQEVGIRQM